MDKEQYKKVSGLLCRSKIVKISKKFKDNPKKNATRLINLESSDRLQKNILHSSYNWPTLRRVSKSQLNASSDGHCKA